MTPLMEQVHVALRARWEGGSLKAECPLHGSEHLYVQPPDEDAFPTFVCRRGATWKDLRPALASAGVSPELLRGQGIENRVEVEPFPSTLALTETYPARLRSREGARHRAFLRELGLRQRDIAREQIGLAKYKGRPRLTLPVYDQHWALQQVRFWDPFADPAHRKVWLRGHGSRHLLGVQHLDAVSVEEPILLAEGESDYLAAVACGVPVVGAAGGAGTVPQDLSAFAGRRVVVAFDNDDAGRSGGRKVAGALMDAGATVWVGDVGALVPAEGGDLRDWLCGGGGDAKALREWMEKTAAEHPFDRQALADDEFDGQVQSRYSALRVDRAARRLVAEDEAAGLFAGFSGRSLSELLAEDREPTPWVIEGLLRQGHKAVLTAAFKVGKTTLLTNVVRALVDDELLFGRFPVHDTGANVAVFDYELTREDAADLYERVAVRNAHRVRVESLRGTGFSLANDVHAEQVVRFLREHECGVWLIDPYARAMRGFGSENSNDDVGHFLARVDQIAAEAGLLGVVISAHTGRGEQMVGSEHARGATKIDDDPDARWVYTRDEAGTRFFRAEGRNRVGCAEFAMAYDPDTELLSASTLTRQDSKHHDRAKAAARIVGGADGGALKATDLQALMPGKDEKPKRAALSYAVQRGWLTADERGGRAGTWYSLGPEPLETMLRRPS